MVTYIISIGDNRMTTITGYKKIGVPVSRVKGITYEEALAGVYDQSYYDFMDKVRFKQLIYGW